MIASQVIEKDVLIDTMIAAEQPVGTFPFRVKFALAGAASQYKIFWEHAQDDVEMPYIVVSHMMGGRSEGTAVNQSYSDTIWKIVVHTAAMAQATDFANTIALLQDRCPVCTRYAGVSPITTLQEKMPVFDRYQVQNVPQFIIGGLYRLQLNLGAN